MNSIFNVMSAAVILATLTGSTLAQDRPIPDVGSMSADDIVTLRQEIMKEDGGLLKGAMAPDADRAAAADHLVHNIEILKLLWPEGSLTANSEALPAIWTDRATFDAYFDDIIAKAGEVKQAALAGDVEAGGAALKAVGGVCGHCHATFRAE
jgi:cytochrome c556